MPHLNRSATSGLTIQDSEHPATRIEDAAVASDGRIQACHLSDPQRLGTCRCAGATGRCDRLEEELSGSLLARAHHGARRHPRLAISEEGQAASKQGEPRFNMFYIYNILMF